MFNVELHFLGKNKHMFALSIVSWHWDYWLFKSFLLDDGLSIKIIVNTDDEMVIMQIS